MKYCPRCGAKESEKAFYKNFCVDCYLHDHRELADIPEVMKVRTCSSCLRMKYRDEWIPGTDENMAKVIESKIDIGLKDPEVIADFLRNTSKGAFFDVTVKGKIAGAEVSKSKEVEVRYDKEECVVCSRKSGGYYEAVLQLRSGSEEELGRLLNFIRNEVRSMCQEDRMAEVFRVMRTGHGIDAEMGSKQVAKKIVSVVKNKFDAEVNESYTLVGVDDSGKDRYTVTYSVRV